MSSQSQAPAQGVAALKQKKRPKYEKPEFPYRSNLALNVQRHIPPTPFGYMGYTWEFKQRGEPWGSSHDQANWCMRKPYPETPPHSDQSVYVLRLLDEIAVGAERGIQVFHCTLNQNDCNGQSLVAKIYDPMYYDTAELGQDVTWVTARDYASEAACYEDLKTSGADGVMTPKYYGSWAFGLPIKSDEGKLDNRPVHLTINEFIPAPSMRSFIVDRKVHLIPPQQRLDLLAQVLETYCKLVFQGVRTLDLSPRNILIRGIDDQTSLPTASATIKFIDFNFAVALSRPNVVNKTRTERPINPMCQFWNGGNKNDFDAWIPQPHRDDDEVYNRWLRDVWGGGRSGEFSIPDGPIRGWRPKYKENLGSLHPPPAPETDVDYWDEEYDDWIPIKRKRHKSGNHPAKLTPGERHQVTGEPEKA